MNHRTDLSFAAIFGRHCCFIQLPVEDANVHDTNCKASSLTKLHLVSSFLNTHTQTHTMYMYIYIIEYFNLIVVAWIVLVGCMV